MMNYHKHLFQKIVPNIIMNRFCNLSGYVTKNSISDEFELITNDINN
jgi:hypothetical protein